MEIDWVILVIFILFASIIAWKAKLLSLSGAFAAFVTGCCIAFGFGIKGLMLIGIFFISSSFFSKFKKKKKHFMDEMHEKGSTRDWAQVVANGGIAAGAGIAASFWTDPLILLAFAISLASANADTWASELGSLSRRPPITIKGFTKVAPGTSGAISVLGTVAGLLGALFIAAAASLLFHFEWTVLFYITLFGFTGMMIDTLFGAYLQAAYKCPNCGQISEKPDHCGREGALIKGYHWLRNDAVNLLSCITAVFLGLILYKM